MTEAHPEKSAKALLALPGIAWGALIVVGFYPTHRAGGSAGIQAMLAAQLVVLATTYPTMFIAMRRMTRQQPAARFQSALAASVARLFATGCVGAAVALTGRVRIPEFLVWVAITYVSMILIETYVLVLWSRRLDRNE